MDPIAALAIIRDDSFDMVDRVQSLGDLYEWLDHGGFWPDPDAQDYVAPSIIHDAWHAITLIVTLI